VVLDVCKSTDRSTDRETSQQSTPFLGERGSNEPRVRSEQCVRLAPFLRYYHFLQYSASPSIVNSN